jgi:hypothetical protein
VLRVLEFEITFHVNSVTSVQRIAGRFARILAWGRACRICPLTSVMSMLVGEMWDGWKVVDRPPRVGRCPRCGAVQCQISVAAQSPSDMTCLLLRTYRSHRVGGRR